MTQEVGKKRGLPSALLIGEGDRDFTAGQFEQTGANARQAQAGKIHCLPRTDEPPARRQPIDDPAGQQRLQLALELGRAEAHDKTRHPFNRQQSAARSPARRPA